MTSFTEPVSTWGFTPAELDAVRAGVAELRRAQAEIARLEAEQVRTRARLMRIASRQVAEAESSEEFEFPIRSMVAEIACAAGLLAPRTRRVAGIASGALLLAVLPANVQMALDAQRAVQRKGWSPRREVMRTGTLLRLPLQAPLVRAAWRAGR